MTSFLSPQYAGENLEEHYDTIANELQVGIEKYDKPFNCRLELPARVARVLSLKCHLRERLQNAYRNGYHEDMVALVDGRVEQLAQEVEALWKYHRQMWMNMYKPFGWEIIDMRYGALRARIDTMKMRLHDYLDSVKRGEDASIPEFDIDLECIYIGSRTNLLLDYSRACTSMR
jgi:hypothetical protein